MESLPLGLRSVATALRFIPGTRANNNDTGLKTRKGCDDVEGTYDLAAPKTVSLCLSIVAVCVVAYFVALGNPFISDDFTLMATVRTLNQNPFYIWDAPSRSEFFRVASYVYFWLCWRVFGPNSLPFYWSGIVLHAVVSLFVYFLVMRITKQRLAAWASALFFAGYGRHEEAVMWISAANELILALSCLAFLLLWEKYLDATLNRRVLYLLSLGAFVVALLSKEAAVILLPLALLRLGSHGHTVAKSFKRSIPLLLMSAGYVSLWLSQAQRNFFVTDHHY